MCKTPEQQDQEPVSEQGSQEAERTLKLRSVLSDQVLHRIVEDFIARVEACFEGTSSGGGAEDHSGTRPQV